ncbi:hypothetical protein D3C87_2005220 [compost metagenome]
MRIAQAGVSDFSANSAEKLATVNFEGSRPLASWMARRTKLPPEPPLSGRL